VLAPTAASLSVSVSVLSSVLAAIWARLLDKSFYLVCSGGGPGQATELPSAAVQSLVIIHICRGGRHAGSLFIARFEQSYNPV
jgi:hypothetical protein